MHAAIRRAILAAPMCLAAALYSRAALADCTFGTPSGGEPDLQVSLNGLLSPAPNTVSGCLSDGLGQGGDAYWSSVGGTSATLLLEIAGFANINSFGLFDSSNPANRLLVFGGAAGTGARARISFAGDGTVTMTSGGTTRSADFGSSVFGFYLHTGQGLTFYSLSTLNPGGVDRMYAYRGNGGRFISGPVATDGNPANDIFGAHDAILAYEDLLAGDNDFQDFVVLVRGVQPVPIPAAALLFGAGLLTLGAAVRRRGRVST